MARINLLPWRAERRAQRQREFVTMLGLAALAGALLSFLLWFHYDRQISGQQTRNAYLQGEIEKVESQIKEIEALDKQKDRLLARKKVIEQLQANRSQMVHLFDSLVRTIPDGVALSNIKQEGDILTLEGRAQSNARVSAYMRNLESSGWMTKPELSIIEAKDQDPKAPVTSASALPYSFNLTVHLANPNASGEAEGTEGNAVPATDAAAPAAAAASNTTTMTPPTPAPAPSQAPAAAPAATPAAPAPTPAAPAPSSTSPASGPINGTPNSATPATPAASNTGSKS